MKTADDIQNEIEQIPPDRIGQWIRDNFYTEKDMEDCFTAGANFARNMWNNPSNTEYMILVKKAK